MSRAIVLVGAVALLVTGFAGAAGSQPLFVLAYARHVSDDITVINVVRADGSDTRALTDGTGLDLPAAWSPDAARLAFERLDASRTYTSLFTVALDGSAPVGIGQSGYDEDPAWSPDGHWLAFQEQTDFGSGGGRADTTFDLWVTRPDGTHLTRLGSGGTDGGSADWVGEGLGWEWSPDAKRIAFVQTVPGATDPSTGESPERLAVADVSTGRVIAHLGPLVSPVANDGWAWSADGRHLAALRPGGVVAVLDIAKRAVTAAQPVGGGTVLSAGDRVPLNGYGIGWQWSPKGSRLAIVQADSAHRDRKTGRAALRLLVLDTSAHDGWIIPGAVSTRSMGDWSLAIADTGWIWSPDGSRLALLRARMGAIIPELSLADLRHRAVHRVGPYSEAAWSPDGRVLALSTGNATASCVGIRLLTVDGGSLMIDRRAKACDTDLAWSPDGSLLAFTRWRGTVRTINTVARNGSRLQEVTPVSPTDTEQWPATCRRLFSYYNGWIVPDNTGAPHLVEPPSSGDATSVARCW